MSNISPIYLQRGVQFAARYFKGEPEVSIGRFIMKYETTLGKTLTNKQIILFEQILVRMDGQRDTYRVDRMLEILREVLGIKEPSIAWYWHPAIQWGVFGVIAMLGLWAMGFFEYQL